MNRRSILLLIFSLLAGAASARCATFKLPEGSAALVSIAIPDTWKPEVIDKGVQGQSADGDVYLSAEVTQTVSDMNSVMDGTDSMLKEHKVKLDPGSRKENKYELNGLPADELTYQARDDQGATVVRITFVSLKDAVLVLTYWASLDAEKNHRKELTALMQSVKSAK